MKGSDCLLIPSKWEGFGLIAVEAMAAGVPVVGANVPGLSEVIGDAGICVNLDCIDDFCKAIKTLKINREFRNKFVLKGLERSKLYSIESMATQYFDEYSKLIEKEAKL